MISRAFACGLDGVNGFPVEVEAFVSKSFVGFEIVGLPGTAVKESRDRVRAAISVNGYRFPFGKVTVNLAPADVHKDGTGFDLAIAAAVLETNEPGRFQGLDTTMLAGELSLQGNLLPVQGALAMAITAAERGFRDLILPKSNAAECQCVENLNIYPAETLKEVFDHLTGAKPLQPLEHVPYQELMKTSSTDADLRFVKGQKLARKALEIAAAGSHNLLMVGTPGSGKTMLARCLPGILPPMNYDESMETTLIHSASGTLQPGSGLLTERPFRSPHHSVSAVAMIGGGNRAHPGEVSLAHNGVLFLDELPEFQRQTLEALRQPIEDGFVNITRLNGQSRFQSRCMLVAGMNPCPCGNFGSKTRQCRCSPYEIKRYLGKISGPLLDRFDLQVEMDAVDIEEIETTEISEDSATVRERVLKAREMQQERYKNQSYFCNAQLDQTGLDQYCSMDAAAKALLHQAAERFHISMRAYSRIRKVARTIADLAGRENITSQDIGLAIQFRNVDGRYWR